MKGIYLTEKAKKEIEAKIIKLEKSNGSDDFEVGMIFATCETYKQILSLATILPVEDNWDEIRLLDGYDSSGTGNLTKAKYPNGVVIKYLKF